MTAMAFAFDDASTDFRMIRDEATQPDRVASFLLQEFPMESTIRTVGD